MRITLWYFYLLHPAFSIVKDVELSFKDFMKKYNKVYHSPVEYEAAMSAFAESLKEIYELRASSNISHEVGLNEYSDMPKKGVDEISAYGASHASRELASNITDLQSVRLLDKLPESVDWSKEGALAPVRNQDTRFRSCGCCYAIAASVVMESRFKIQAQLEKVVPLSVQQIVDCSEPQGNFGCNGGNPNSAYKYARTNGMTKASAYPFKAKKGTCKTSVVKDPRKQCFKEGDISIISRIPPANEAAMMKAVASGPVAVDLHSEAPAFWNYKSGIITAESCGDGSKDHSVVIVGYGTSRAQIPYWKIINTWGKSWGMKGFAYIERTGTKIPRGACGILTRPQQIPIFKSSVKL